MARESVVDHWATGEITSKQRSLWEDAFRRLLRNRLAVLGGAIIIVMTLAAVFAPIIQRHDPEAQFLKSTLEDPRGEF